MLKTLFIENYALIDKVEIEFNDGFSVITGETGAGKSILLGALSLILGNRADTSVLKNKEIKCVVEAQFDIKSYQLNKFFTENDLEYEDISIIRRTILPSGKSRAYLNDEPVNLNILKELGAKLIDIHSQNQNFLINSEEFQYKVVDSIAHLQSELLEYNSVYKKYKKSLKELNELKEQIERRKESYDYDFHRFKMLEEAHLDELNLSELETRQKQLANYEDIKLSFSKADFILSQEEELNIQGKIKEITTNFAEISEFSPLASELSERLDILRIELKDIADVITVESENIDFDQDELEKINQKVDLIFNLLQNFRLKDVSQLIELREKLKKQLDLVDNFDFEFNEKQKQVNKVEAKLNKIAQNLSKKRIKNALKIEKYVVEVLQYLGMPNAKLKIEVQETEKYNYFGFNSIQFLFSANKKQELQEMSKVASGGEISRVMLTLKSLLSSYTKLPSIVFDEIDTGVSGDIASKMGQIMHEMGKEMQVISITHLPQVAAQGETHYLVYKKDTKDGTHSNILKLANNERLEAIARMLSGDSVTNAAIENAKELLKLKN